MQELNVAISGTWVKKFIQRDLRRVCAEHFLEHGNF
jgi:hypothetical protein